MKLTLQYFLCKYRKMLILWKIYCNKGRKIKKILIWQKYREKKKEREKETHGSWLSRKLLDFIGINKLKKFKYTKFSSAIGICKNCYRIFVESLLIFLVTLKFNFIYSHCSYNKWPYIIKMLYNIIFTLYNIILINQYF